jgi:hypothetical protein
MLTTTPYYFSSVRNLTAAFGMLFNNIKIVRYQNDGTVGSILKVPLAYGPGDKAITMLQQQADARANDSVSVKMILPRMSFELTGVTYDNARKTPSVNKNYYNPPKNLSFNASTNVNIVDNTITIVQHDLKKGQGITYQKGAGTVIGGLIHYDTYYAIPINNNTFKVAATKELAEAGTALDLTSLGSGTAKFVSSYLVQYGAIPYRFEYTLGIYVKYIDDGLQIIEQILPAFKPFYTITMKDIASVELHRDVNITLMSVSHEDIYDGTIDDDRTIKWTLTFSADSWIYPPIQDGKLIKKVTTNFVNFDNNQHLVTVELQVLDDDINDPYTINVTKTENEGGL